MLHQKLQDGINQISMIVIKFFLIFIYIGNWSNAIISTASASNSILKSQVFEPIKKLSVLIPKEMTKPKPEMQIFDFG